MNAVLEVAGVHKSYGDRPALRGVDLTVNPGEIVGLLGPNGAGKSTLVSIVAGLKRPDAGTVHVTGIDVGRQPGQARDHLGLAPQELGIYPIVSVRHNLSVFGEIAGLRGAVLRKRVDDVADAMGLTELMDRLAGHLSGGEKRRLHTGMALLHRPELLLLDEPTAGSDVQSRNRLLATVRDLAAAGAGVVYSTHYLPEIEDLGATVVLIDRGEVLARGSVHDLIAQHAHATIELSFDGPAPSIAHAGAQPPDGAVVRIRTDDAAATAASVLTQLGRDATRLRGVDIVQPSLEAVYLSITGRRYDGDGAGDPAGATEPTGEGDRVHA